MNAPDTGNRPDADEDQDIAEAVRSVKRLSAELLSVAGETDFPRTPRRDRRPGRRRGDSEERERARQKIVSLRERLEHAARNNRREEVTEIMREIALLAGGGMAAGAFPGFDGGHGGASPLPPPLYPPVPVPAPQGLSAAAVIFLLANTVMATATITSIAWYLVQTAASQRGVPSSANPAAAPASGTDRAEGRIELGRKWEP